MIIFHELVLRVPTFFLGLGGCTDTFLRNGMALRWWLLMKNTRLTRSPTSELVPPAQIRYSAEAGEREHSQAAFRAFQTSNLWDRGTPNFKQHRMWDYVASTRDSSSPTAPCQGF